MGTEVNRFDAAEYLGDEASQIEYLSEAFATGDASYIAHAIGVVAKARGMTEIAEETGVKRQQLYRALSRTGNPTLGTLTKVLEALGVKLAALPA